VLAAGMAWMSSPVEFISETISRPEAFQTRSLSDQKPLRPDAFQTRRFPAKNLPSLEFLEREQDARAQFGYFLGWE
jgi:hypothetical protein